jgi:hypothetical protein
VSASMAVGSGRAHRAGAACPSVLAAPLHALRAIVGEASTRASQHFVTGAIHHLKPSSEAANQRWRARRSNERRNPAWKLPSLLQRRALRLCEIMQQLTDAGKFNANCPHAGDCHSGNLRCVVVVASTAPFGPSALMLNW